MMMNHDECEYDELIDWKYEPRECQHEICCRIITVIQDNELIGSNKYTKGIVIQNILWEDAVMDSKNNTCVT